jgi:hypothetical protein
MTLRSVRTAGAICLLLLGASACPPPRGTSPEEVRRRLLEYQGLRLHDRLFFVGIARAATLELATQAAFGEITRQLTWLPAGSQEMLRGMYRVDRKVSDDAGEMQVLAILEREAAEAHLRILYQAEDSGALQLLHQCEGLLKAGEAAAATTCLEGARAKVTRAGELHAASRSAVGDHARRAPLASEALAVELTQQLGTTRTGRRSFLLHVLRDLDGRSAGDLDTEFSPLLIDRGLRRAQGELAAESVTGALAGSPEAALASARRSQAGFVVVGRVSARFASEDSGQFFSFADGTLRVIESTAGRILVEVSCKDVKGGHISRRQANERAVREAVASLKGKLKEKLVAIAR